MFATGERRPDCGCRCLEAFETSIHPLGLSEKELSNRTPVGSDDTALGAFAQLGALRLGAQRCMISLLTKDTEFILAESTRTLSLQSDLVHNARDALWLGTTHFPRDQGLAIAGLNHWTKTKDTRESPHEDDFYYTDGISPHWHIISDLRQYPQSNDVLFVRAGKNLRFYAAVPIRTTGGLVVGSYSVLDDKPRFGISADDMVFMEDIADTIMGHLVAKRSAMQRQRGDRLIKGLALFNEGKDSLRDWWLEHYSRNVRGEGQRRRRGSMNEEEDRNDRADDELGMTYRADEIPHGRAPSSAESKEIQNHDKEAKSSLRIGQLSRDTHEGFDLNHEIDAAFARSSNLLREAINSEGVAFVDADFARSKIATQSTKNHDMSTTDLESDTSSSSPSRKRSSSQKANLGPEDQCALLGFSTKVKSTLRGFAPSSKHSSLPKAFIRRLIRRYPMGKVFNYHDGKALSSSSGTDFDTDELDETKATRSRKRRSRELTDATTLAEVFANPRSIAFLPLWDVSTFITAYTRTMLTKCYNRAVVRDGDRPLSCGTMLPIDSLTRPKM